MAGQPGGPCEGGKIRATAGNVAGHRLVGALHDGAMIPMRFGVGVSHGGMIPMRFGVGVSHVGMIPMRFGVGVSHRGMITMRFAVGGVGIVDNNGSVIGVARVRSSGARRASASRSSSRLVAVGSGTVTIVIGVGVGPVADIGQVVAPVTNVATVHHPSSGLSSGERDRGREASAHRGQ